MLIKDWVVYAADQARRASLSELLSISPITAAVLLARGIVTADQARNWLSPIRAPLHDPLLIPGMAEALKRLHRAVTTQERICFYGDYDVDGVAATSIYLAFFRSLGAQAVAYIPHRIREGYGLHAAALRRFYNEGLKLIVTADCGTTATDEIAMGTQLGLDIIVTDHHQPGDPLPPALALLNPHRIDSCYPFSGLCSAGVAYQVVRAYAWQYGPVPIDPESLLDLVALATVADVVPLHDENRYFVREGLRLISRGARTGLRALKLVSGIDQTCTSATVAFKLAPRINAAGRLGHADTGVKLLTTESELEARALALHLDELNRERQKIEETTLREAFAAVGCGDPPAALIIWAKAWHLGVVGIVAARLVERYHRPAFVISVSDQGIGKGSARGVPGFNLYAALAQCRDLLIGFGGHPNAAGLTVGEDQLPFLRERLVAIAEQWISNQPRRQVLHVDALVELADIRPAVVHELDRLNPYGAGNPEPTLVASNVAVLSMKVVGNGHLKVTVRHDSSQPFDGIGFRMGKLAETTLLGRSRLDLAFIPELNRWNGCDRIQLRIRDIRASQA
jgi:single-stranded-DNA-specific exonuclease